MDSSAYGFSEQDLIDLRFYCDISKKTPNELASELKSQSKDPTEAAIRDICYDFLSTKRTATSIEQLEKTLLNLTEIKS